jgi:hypothetical protein
VRLVLGIGLRGRGRQQLRRVLSWSLYRVRMKETGEDWLGESERELEREGMAGGGLTESSIGKGGEDCEVDADEVEAHDLCRREERVIAKQRHQRIVEGLCDHDVGEVNDDVSVGAESVLRGVLPCLMRVGGLR